MKHKVAPILGKWDFIFLLGESGGGKGTLVKSIHKFWLTDITSASMGDIFRERAKTDPEIKHMTENGKLIGDDVVAEQFRRFAEETTPGIIDGYPRSRGQALDAIKFVKEMGWRVLVVDIHCSLEVIIERLLARGRADDKLEVMHKRNQDHKELHPAVMNEIRLRPDLFDVIDIDGDFEMNKVFSLFLLEILRLVDPLYLYDSGIINAEFSVGKDETTLNEAINRLISQVLVQIQSKLGQ